MREKDMQDVSASPPPELQASVVQVKIHGADSVASSTYWTMHWVALAVIAVAVVIILSARIRSPESA
jgi:hypothetical protein